MNLKTAKEHWTAKKKRKRIGRGEASGTGKTAGRGHGGAKSRSGGKIKATMAGGQTPLFRRLPKVGFTNYHFRTLYRVVNLKALNVLEDGTEVTPELLLEKGLVHKGKDGVKVLGFGDITKKLTVKASKFSASAKEKIEAAGGSCEVLS